MPWRSCANSCGSNCVNGSMRADSPPRRTERRVLVREGALGVLRTSGAILPQREFTRMVNEVSGEVVGFGSIEFLLKDPSVTEVMVNGPDG
jgi:pilus assembly protein CpaF